MQVKEEPKDPEYKSCQYESSSGCKDVSQGLFCTTGTNGQNLVADSEFGKGYFPEDNLSNMLNNNFQHQFQPMPQSKPIDTPIFQSEMCRQNTQNTEMSHALPKRIAQVQRMLHPGLTHKRQLAQPKESENSKRNRIQVEKRIENVNNKMHTLYAMKNLSPNPADSKTFEKCRNKIQNNSVSKQSPQAYTSNFQTYQDDKKLRGQATSKLEESEPPAMEGLFGWTLIDNIYIPYIFRADNEKYVCVRLLEYKVLKKYPNIFPEELAIREPLTSSFIRPNECRVFNQLVRMQYKGQPDIPVFNQDDVVVLLKEFLEFYSIVKKTFPGCEKTRPRLIRSQKLKPIKSGWVQINNTIIPFIYRSFVKFLPLAVLKHAASIEVPSEGVPPTDDECKELNNRCAAEGFKFIFKQSSRLVSLNDVKSLSEVQVFELPEKDPLNHAHYVSTDDDPPEGLKINTQELDSPNVNAFQEFPFHDALVSPKSDIEIDEYDNQEFPQSTITFAYNRFPTNVKHGSPNVSIVPQNRLRHCLDAHRMPNTVTRFPNTHPSSSQHISAFNIDRPTILPPKAHSQSYRQPLIPRTFLNAFTPGQNINVNYGINIQNITPAQQASKSQDKDVAQMEQTSITEQNFQSNALLLQGLRVMPPHSSFSPKGMSRKISSKPHTCSGTSENFEEVCLSDKPLNMVKNSVSMTNQNQETLLDVNSSHMRSEVNGQNNLFDKSYGNNVNDNNNGSSTTQPEGTYQMRQRQAIGELISCIKGVWLAGKNISCLHLNKPGRTGKFCLVEAICKLYYGNRSVSEFLFTIEKVLMTITCTELEEQAFIEYYQLPVNVLKCNKMIELTAFERLYPQLTEVLNGVYPQYYSTSSNTRCLLPLFDTASSHLPPPRRISGEQNITEKTDNQEHDDDKVIVLDG